ncbi:MAG: hypothetical protein SGJ21_10955 [Alphaproteobacteria bacterium]|nr:hypothetical protein [Alphaproteobacteria bacterium]
MSVLQLRRDMAVPDAVVEIDAPFPLRTINVTPRAAEQNLESEAPADDDDEDRKSFGARARGWLIGLSAVCALGAYPALIVLSSEVGDRSAANLVDRTQWTVPWAGGVALLMERHFETLGWASDAPSWAPMARLTAKPAYQAALAGALGEYVSMMNQHADSSGRPDSDLEAASRLVNAGSTGVQLRAARDALVNYDRRERRRGAGVEADTARLIAQLGLVETWAMRSQSDVAQSANLAGGNPIDESATNAVYAAKARANAALVLIEAMDWPETTGAEAARAAALKAWRAASEFRPLIVLNGSADGWLFGNHAVSMGFLLAQAQGATSKFLDLLDSPSQGGRSLAAASMPQTTVN